MREERDELQNMTSERTRQNEELQKANEAKEKSEAYIASLKQEIQYLAATKEEQIKLDAAKNATVEDQGEAERLLKERDAIIAKIEAQKELEEAQKRAEEERAKAAEKAIQDAQREQERIAGIVKSEQQRLALRAIELEQGKEAAKAQALMNQGVEEATAKQLAAAEAEMEKEKTPLKKPKETGPLMASESRLLTRGKGSDPMDKTNKILEQTQKLTQELAKFNAQQLELQQKIAENTAKGAKLVAVS